MISFRTRDDMIASVITILALFMLAGTLAWMVFVKPPDEAGIANGKHKNEMQLTKQIAQAKANNEALQKAIDPALWTGTPEQVGPNALAQVTKLAKLRSLKLVAFRPQKPVDAEGLTQVPFTASVDGSFPNTMKFVKDLETSNSKLAVSLVQVNSADAATDHVTGTVNVVAYLRAGIASAGGTNAQKSK